MAGTPPGFNASQFVAEGQQRTDAQRAALLNVIAEQGAVGAQAYAQGQAQINNVGNASRQQAMANQQGSAITDPGYAGAEDARRQSMLDLYRADMSAGDASLRGDMSRMSASNAQYMGEVSASLPHVAAGVQRDISALQSKVEEERKRREHEAQMRAMALEAQRMEIAAAKSRAQGGDDPLLDLKRDSMSLENEAARRALTAGNPDERLANTRTERLRINREVDKLGPRAKAAYHHMYGGKSAWNTQKMGVINVGGQKLDMRGLNYGLLEDILRRDYANRDAAAQFGFEF